MVFDVSGSTVQWVRQFNDKRLCHPWEIPDPDPDRETASPLQPHQRSFKACLQICVEGYGIDWEVAAGTRQKTFLWGNYQEGQCRSPEGLFFTLSEEAVGHVQQDGVHCQRDWKDVACEPTDLSWLSFSRTSFFSLFQRTNCCLLGNYCS